MLSAVDLGLDVFSLDVSEADFGPAVEVRNQVSHPLRLDSGRSSNRHIYPSANTS